MTDKGDDFMTKSGPRGAPLTREKSQAIREIADLKAHRMRVGDALKSLPQESKECKFVAIPRFTNEFGE